MYNFDKNMEIDIFSQTKIDTLSELQNKFRNVLVNNGMATEIDPRIKIKKGEDVNKYLYPTFDGCQTCEHDGVDGASYEMDKCYGCNAPKLNNHTSNTEFITEKEMKVW